MAFMMAFVSASALLYFSFTGGPTRTVTVGGVTTFSTFGTRADRGHTFSVPHSPMGMTGASVVVLDALTYAGDKRNLDPVANSDRLEFVEGNILDSALLDDLLPNVDAVVHFAAESHVDRSIADPYASRSVVGVHALPGVVCSGRRKRFRCRSC